MKKAGLLMCLLAGIAFASTKSFTITLFEPAMVGGTQLKAGDYKCEIQNQKIVLKRGHSATEAAVKVETAERKYDTTAVTYNYANGKNKVQEIVVGGTHTKLVLN